MFFFCTNIIPLFHKRQTFTLSFDTKESLRNFSGGKEDYKYIFRSKNSSISERLFVFLCTKIISFSHETQTFGLRFHTYKSFKSFSGDTVVPQVDFPMQKYKHRQTAFHLFLLYENNVTFL